MNMRGGDNDDGSRQPQSLAEKAYDIIEQMIIGRVLAPGAMLSESTLAEELSLGRTPVREALAKLKSIGFVEIHSRRGVLVTNVDVVRHLELLEVRRPLDETVARCVIRRASDADLRELGARSEALAVSAARGAREPYFRAKRDLHEAASRSCYNTTLSSTMTTLHAQSRRFWYSYEPVEAFGDSAKFHAQIVEGMIKRDEAQAISSVAKLFVFLDGLTRQSLDRRPLV